MTDKQIIEYKHIKCTKEDCCLYCGSIYCGYVDDIENLEKAYKSKEQEYDQLKDDIINLHFTLGKKDGRIHTLYQTLQEIKEIAETQQSWNEWNRQFSETESEDDIFAYNWSALKQILQKISEVKNDR